MTRATTRVFAIAALLFAAGSAAFAYNPEHVKFLMANRKCPGCSLDGAEFPGANLEGVDLKGANLTDANLYKANLSGADLTDATLSGANLIGAHLKDAVGAVLAGSTTDATTECPSGDAGPCS